MTTRTTHTNWTITRLEQALLDHLDGRKDWPTQNEWYSTTPSTRMYSAMRRHGGVHSWAARLGYHVERRATPNRGPRHRKHTPASIGACLQQMCNTTGQFPTVEQIIAQQGDGFYAAMRDFGGIAAWSRSCGFAPRRPGRPAGSTNTSNTQWTPARIREELAPFLHRCTQWPSTEEFRQSDLARLHTACIRHGGLAYWAQEFGLPAPRQNDARRKSVDEVRRALKTFLDARNLPSWPTINEFRDAGEYGLLSQVYKHGGHAHWAQEFGYPDPTGRRSSAAKYTHSRVYLELSEMVSALGLQTRLPTDDEFRDAKRVNLNKAMHRLGGAQVWFDLLGLTAPAAQPAFA